MHDYEGDFRLDVPDPVPYRQQLAEKHAAQATMTRQQVMQQMVDEGAAVQDLDEIVEAGRKVQHFWVDRGLKLSCEGATHPNHHVWKKKH